MIVYRTIGIVRSEQELNDVLEHGKHFWWGMEGGSSKGDYHTAVYRNPVGLVGVPVIAYANDEGVRVLRAAGYALP